MNRPPSQVPLGEAGGEMPARVDAARRARTARGRSGARRIRVCHLTPSFSGGGAEERIARLLHSMDRETFDLAWMGFGKVQHGLIERAGLGIDLCSFDRSPDRGVETHLILSMARELVRLAPDVLHAHNWSTSLYGIAAARLAGVPFVIYGDGGRDSPEGPSPRRRALMRALAPHVDCFTAVCRFLGDEIVEHWGVPASRVRVIPNGVDLENLDAAPPRAQARAAVGVPEDAVVIGALAGRFREVKRVPLLVEAVGRIARQRPSVHLLLVGDPLGHEAEIRAQAAALGLTGRIHLPGHVPGISSVVNAFDIVVNCSVFEGASNAILEAMGARRAVVATAVGGTPEAIEHGRSGLLIPPEDCETLARALATLVDRPEQRVALGEGARARIEARHTHRAMLEGYVELYRSAPAQRPTGWIRRVGDLGASLASLASLARGAGA